jgi:hypothetical protein
MALLLRLCRYITKSLPRQKHKLASASVSRITTRDLLKHTISVTVSPGDVKSGVNLTMPNIRKKTMDYSGEVEADSLLSSALWLCTQSSKTPYVYGNITATGAHLDRIRRQVVLVYVVAYRAFQRLRKH